MILSIPAAPAPLFGKVDPTYLRLHYATAGFLIFAAIGKYAYIRSVGMEPNIGPAVLASAGFLAIGFVTMIYGRELLSLIANSLAILTLATMSAATTAALVLHTGRDFPFIDDLLVRADALIGFNWRTYAEWMIQYPKSLKVLYVAYESITWQATALLPLMIFLRQAERFYVFTIAMVVSLAIVCVFALFFPAIGPYDYLGVHHIPQGLIFTADSATPGINWLRQDVLTAPQPATPVGLLYCPSYHASCAILYMWAGWRLPIVKWGFVVVNMLMLAATPIHGSHYLIDVVLGVAVAIVTLWAVKLVTRRVVGTVA